MAGREGRKMEGTNKLTSIPSFLLKNKQNHRAIEHMFKKKQRQKKQIIPGVTRFKVGCERGRWLPDWFAKSRVGLWRFGEPVWCVSYDSRSGVTVWERDVADWGLKMKMVAGGRGMWLTGVWRWRWWERNVADRRLKMKMKMVGEGCG